MIITTVPKAQERRYVLDITSLYWRKKEVSDTHKARRAGSPGHRAGSSVELNSSLRVVSSNRCRDYGEQCFQFLFFRLRLNVREKAFSLFFWFRCKCKIKR